MNTHHDESKNKLVVYTRRSQNGTTRKHKEPLEITEANLFVFAQKLGFRETSGKCPTK